MMFARYTASAEPAVKGPDSYAKLITLVLPIVRGLLALSFISIVEYNAGALLKLVIRTKLPKSEVSVLFISVVNVLGFSTSLYVVDNLSVL